MTTLVQPIVLRASGTHAEAVEAAARASWGLGQMLPGNPAWPAWLAGHHTKSVRRAKPSLFERLCEEYGVVSAEVVGGAAAFALVPMPYDSFGSLRSLQVSGTEMPRDHEVLDALPEGFSGLVVDASLGMSTGKEAAQVAHGVWQAGGWAPVVRVDAQCFASAKHSATSVVTDSGLTELDGPTPTVAVLT